MVAIDRMLRIMDRRAKLLGLDMPTKVAPTTPDGEQSASTEESARWVYYLPKPCETEQRALIRWQYTERFFGLPPMFGPVYGGVHG